MDGLTNLPPRPLPPIRRTRRRLLLWSVVALAAVLGTSLIVWRFVVRDESPDYVYLQVRTTYPKAGALEVAERVAAPVEEQVNGTEGVVCLSSWSKHDGSYVLRIAFRRGTDLEAVLPLVVNRVALARPLLPKEVESITFHKEPASDGPRKGLTAVLVSDDGFDGPRESVRLLEKL